MRVFRGFDNLPTFRHAVATIGSFDGVHCGHRVLLNEVRSITSQQGGESIVFTFDPHPRITLGKAEGLRLISTTEEKLRLLESEGVDNVIIIPFTLEFSRLSPEDFIRKVLIEMVGVKYLVVGYNHHFGHNKAGDFELLADNSAGLNIVRVEQHRVASDKVSSTIIRNAIKQGDMAQAERLLGHPFIIIGVLSNDGSVEYSEREYKQLPPAGEYSVRVGCVDNHLIIDTDGSLHLKSVVAQSQKSLIIEFCV